MQNFSPLSSIGTVSANNDIEPPDIVVTKRSLQCLGHYSPQQTPLTEITDDSMFSGIRSFQEKERLTIDGRMVTDGETATSIGRMLAPKTPQIFIRETAEKDDKPALEQCDHLYWNVDIPTCRAVFAKRGKGAPPDVFTPQRCAMRCA